MEDAHKTPIERGDLIEYVGESPYNSLLLVLDFEYPVFPQVDSGDRLQEKKEKWIRAYSIKYDTRMSPLLPPRLCKVVSKKRKKKNDEEG